MAAKTTPKAEEKLTPSENVDAQIEAEETEKDLLEGLPQLLPAHRFRARHRADFNNIRMNILKEKLLDGVEEGDEVGEDDPVGRYQDLMELAASVDEWAETIAEDPTAYAEWAAGKDFNVFMALYVKYQRELGESTRSEN